MLRQIKESFKKKALVIATIVPVMPNPAQACDEVQLSFMPSSKHYGERFEPKDGYNEAQNAIQILCNRVFEISPRSDFVLGVGGTIFKNSFGKKSKGIGGNAEFRYKLADHFGVYGGVHVGMVDGYQDHIHAPDIFIGDFMLFATENLGVSYDASDHVTWRTGVAITPQIKGFNDGAVIGTFGMSYRF